MSIRIDGDIGTLLTELNSKYHKDFMYGVSDLCYNQEAVTRR